jgi:RNA-binding protein MEX3
MREGDPVFVISGSQENVGKAKWEIISAAEHFSALRATCDELAKRRQLMIMATHGNEITISFEIPLRLVGLIVGTRGSTIKQFMQISNTLIQSPALNGDPVFHVTGNPTNVKRAKELIENYIKLRTENDTDLIDLYSYSRHGARLSKEYLQHRCLVCCLVNIKSHTILVTF